MKRPTLSIFLALLLGLSLLPIDTVAARPSGGGGMRAGGGSRSSGGSARFSGGNTKVNMQNRGNVSNFNRPATVNSGNAGNINRGNVGNVNRSNVGNVNRGNTGNINNAGNINRGNVGNVNRSNVGNINNAGNINRGNVGTINRGDVNINRGDVNVNRNINRDQNWYGGGCRSNCWGAGGGWWGRGYYTPPGWGLATFGTGLAIGAALSSAPPYYDTVYVGGSPYLYSDGIYVQPSGSSYIVTAPPVGAVVGYLPDGCTATNSNGTQLFECSGVVYQPFYQNGDVVYQVVSATTG